MFDPDSLKRRVLGALNKPNETTPPAGTPRNSDGTFAGSGDAPRKADGTLDLAEVRRRILGGTNGDEDRADGDPPPPGTKRTYPPDVTLAQHQAEIDRWARDVVACLAKTDQPVTREHVALLTTGHARGICGDALSGLSDDELATEIAKVIKL